MFWRDNNKSAIGLFVAHSGSSEYGWEIHAGYGKNSDFVGRIQENGTWGNARTFITSANIGSQSVDKVDGLHFWTGPSLPSSTSSDTIYIIV